MARSLRIQFSGALYHLTSRGDGRDNIFLSDEDRQLFLEIFELVCRRFRWVCYAYCLMSNHYHLLVETPEANLCKGMQLLNGMYTQKFNKSHARVGHVFQGRYKGILVEKDSYLLELSRYIVLNPVRAHMVISASDWIWSSYLATSLQMNNPSWLKIGFILSFFSQDLSIAVKKYREFVEDGTNCPSPWDNLKNQIYLGSDDFVKEMQNKIDLEQNLIDIPIPQYTPDTCSLEEYDKKSLHRNQCIKLAYESGRFSMKEIGDYFGLHYSRISYILKDFRL